MSPSPQLKKSELFGVGVRFRRKDGTWSKAYTYKSKISYPKYTYVIVPVDDWWQVGVVDTCEADFKFDPEINYKFIHQSIERPE